MNACAVEVIASPDKVASVLPIGIVKIEGAFERGDVVTLTVVGILNDVRVKLENVKKLPDPTPLAQAA